MLLSIPGFAQNKDKKSGDDKKAGGLVGGESPKEVRMKAQMALSQGSYSEAVPYLQQLVEWYKNETKPDMVASMEGIYFSLGCCHFFLAQFGEAQESFAAYLKKYPNKPRAGEVAVYIADGHRFQGDLDRALKLYADALKKYDLGFDLKADCYAAMARCYIAQDKWDKAVPVLQDLYTTASDFTPRNWSASMLTTAFLKQMSLGRVYKLVPYLLSPNSFISRSVALNLAALESGDMLFADERYRDSLWVYRLIYPHDILMTRSQQHLETLKADAERLKRLVDNPRPLIRVQEQIGELEGEIKALESIDNYDVELNFRMARAYMEIRRYREGRDLFLYLHGQTEGKKAQEALFFAFHCAVRIQPWQRAFDLGEEYMKLYPAGEYYDQISVTVGQMYAKQEDWPKVLSTLTKAMEVSPKHSEAAECFFLMGYASFMEENFTNSVSYMVKMNQTYPGNPREADGTYWAGMGLMFDKKFEAAAKEFDNVVKNHEASPFTQDATFRRAVCDFGLSKFKEAEAGLRKFIGKYPESKLCGEAHMMLADIYGATAQIKEAIEEYRQVPRFDVNIEFYNYSYFRCAEMMKELQDHAGIIQMFNEYIKENREGCNIPQALYWIGGAKWDMGERKGALEFFRNSVEKYGVNRRDLGIDMILEEWIGRNKGVDASVRDSAWKDLMELLEKAQRNKLKPLELRLKRVCVYQPNISEDRKKALLDDLVREENLTNASPGVMELMLDEAQKRGNRELAIKVAEQLIQDFTETDYALSARMLLAKLALEAQNFEEAIRHLNVVREVYATTDQAAEALLQLGDVYIKQGKHAEADECFKNILGVKEWRGPLWPAALFGRGEAAKLAKSYDQACAYFERIYVMYGNHKKWCAKAYVARADCLVRLQMYNKAAETLEAMLASPDFKDTPEAAEASQKLTDIKRRM